MKYTRAAAACVAAAALALTGCAKSGPVTHADMAAGTHIATEVLNTCVKQVGGTVQSTPAATMASALPGLIHHSGRKTAYTCLKAHVSGTQLSGWKTCIEDGIINGAGEMATKKGAEKVGQGIFTCAAGVMAK